MKISDAACARLRKSPNVVKLITRLTTEQRDEANLDFWRTASKEHKRNSERTGREPYDSSIVIGTDRVRGYVQTANYAARRHERKNSSLLRVVARKAL